MSGRWQAAVVAFLGIPVVSQAVVGLVLLRCRMFDGTLILLALLVPIFILAMLFEFKGLVLLLPQILMGLLIFGGALLLRYSRSWSLTLAVTTIGGTLGAALIRFFIVPSEDLLAMAETMAVNGQGNTAFVDALAQVPIDDAYAGMMGLMVAIFSGASLILARWWQSLLYNPGGFQHEFHALRIEPKLVLLCALVQLAYSAMSGLGVGLGMLLIPLFFGGLGFIHWWSASRNIAFVPWVVYLLLVLSPALAIFIAALGLLDSAFNLRKRFNSMQR